MHIYIILFIISVQFPHTIFSDSPKTIKERILETPYEINPKTDFWNDEKLRIEMIREQLLNSLNLEEAPPSLERAPEESKEMIKLLMKEEEEWQQKRNRLASSEERLVIHAKKYSKRCVYSNATYCRMHSFELSRSLNTSSVDLWIYKQTVHPKWITIVLSSSTSNDIKQYESLYYETHEAGWNKLKLPKLYTQISSNETCIITIEINGHHIEYVGEHRPFLLVSKLANVILRQRREGCNTNVTCCLISLSVSFAEIGFNWVLYPSELEANMCSGKCEKNPSTVGTHYEIAMLKMLEKNNSAKDALGECWTLCCKPKILEPVRVFYNDTDGIIHDQYIPDLSVKSCSC